jgi:hypothetical protein
MLDGIYSMVFRGAADWGMGMLVLQGGQVTGSDASGVLYDGNYEERGSDIELQVIMTVPPGVTLVQGTPARSTSYAIPVRLTMSKSSLENNEPVLLPLAPGPVNVIFRRLRSLSK